MIILITSKIKVGGTENYLFNLAKNFKKRGLQVKILSLHYKDYDRELYKNMQSVAEVFFLKDLLKFNSLLIPEKINFFFPMSSLRVKGLLNNVKTIVSTSPITYLISRKILKHTKPKALVFCNFHFKELSWGDPQSLPLSERVLRNDISKNCLSVIFATKSDLEVYKKNNPLYPLTNSHILPLGIENQKYIYSKNRTYKFAVMARLDTHKKFINSIFKILESNKNLSVELIGEGPIKQNILKISNNLGLQNRINFRGFLSGNNLEECFANIDFVITSGSGLTLATSYGVPCIVGLEEYEDKTIGIFSDEENLNYSDQSVPIEKTDSFTNYINKFYLNYDVYVSEAKCLQNVINETRSMNKISSEFIKICDNSPEINGSNIFLKWGLIWILDQIKSFFTGKGAYKDKLK